MVAVGTHAGKFGYGHELIQSHGTTVTTSDVGDVLQRNDNIIISTLEVHCADIPGVHRVTSRPFCCHEACTACGIIGKSGVGANMDSVQRSLL